MYYDFMDLLSPLRISEMPSYLKVDLYNLDKVWKNNFCSLSFVKDKSIGLTL